MTDFDVNAEEVTPQHKHLMKQVKEDKARKKSKAIASNESVEMIASSFGRIKYRKVIKTASGNVYRLPISKEDYDRFLAKK